MEQMVDEDHSSIAHVHEPDSTLMNNNHMSQMDEGTGMHGSIVGSLQSHAQVNGH